MDEQQVVFDGRPEFVARGRVESEKAELLREVREGVQELQREKGRVLVAGRVSSPQPRLGEGSVLARHPPRDPLLTFLVVLAWFAAALAALKMVI